MVRYGSDSMALDYEAGSHCWKVDNRYVFFFEMSS